MTDNVKTDYELERSYFSFWQVMAFILVFAFIGSWVLRTFAGEPQIKSFTISNQRGSQVEFTAKASKKPADDLAVTNTCDISNFPGTTTQAIPAGCPLIYRPSKNVQPTSTPAMIRPGWPT
jgi:hypothetical protein